MDGYGEFFQEQVHKWLFGQSPTDPISPKYVALSTSSFEPDGSGIAEPIGPTTSYIRAEAPDAYFDVIERPVPYVTQTDNAHDITFVESTASWGLITSFGVFNSAVDTGLNDLYFGGDLPAPGKTIDDATIAVFSVGNLVLQTKNNGL